MTNEQISALAEAISNNQPAVLVTVVEVNGASPAKVGAQLLLLGDETRFGTVGGGRLESAILEDARKVLAGGAPQLKHYTLKEEGPDAIGVLCSGEFRAFFQPYRPPLKLVIVGRGHIGRPLKAMGEYIGMIGSRAKCQIILEHLRSDGFGDDALSRIYAPIGLDLGGSSPQEIAVAILAEIIAVRRGKKGVPVTSRSR